MKENLKNKKGITLIALVITIIVLLILAIVTIRIVVNQNIINHANNAVTAYNEAQQNEAEQLTWVEELMKNKGGSSTAGSGDSSSNSENSNDLFAVAGVTTVEAGNDRVVAERDTGDTATVFFTLQDENTAFAVNVMVNETVYVMIKDNNTLKDLGITGDTTKIKESTWYTMSFDNAVSDNKDVSMLTEYTGNAPINRDSFTKVYDEAYLQRVINSFGK